MLRFSFGFNALSNQVVTSLKKSRRVPLLSVLRVGSRNLSGEGKQKYEFQAETRKLLDIVTNSIYTDKEVFLRELISNSSDALEKMRYKMTTGEFSSKEGSEPLEINIFTDKEQRTLTIIDNGIGMSKADLISNLGTIARSGSKAFVEQLKSDSKADVTAATTDGIIGQFGVGFYSSFMVSENVTVESLPAIPEPGAEIVGHEWVSDGSGEYTLSESSNPLTRGSKITMKLKESCIEFADPKRVTEIIKRYSSFVTFPIRVDGNPVNTVSAIWTQDKSQVTDKQYNEFYRFIGNAYDDPKFTMHFKVDAPLDLKVLIFFPTFHTEKFGMARLEPGVNLFSRRVLIESKPKDLLPDWLRFLKGVVDSEDLPLSISREKPQDTNLLKRIRDVLTRKVIRFLEDKSKNDPEKYKEFYIEYSHFLKEGVCQDHKYMEQLSKLLLFESSTSEEGFLVSFDDYISRCPPEQKKIYYLVAPNRATALNSPYYETFKKHKKEVLFLYNTIDDFAMANLKTFSGRELVSADNASVDLDKESSPDSTEGAEDKDNLAEKAGEEDSGDEMKKSKVKLNDAEIDELKAYLQATLGPKKVREIRVTNRLADSPAIVTDNESGSVRRMMRMVEQANNGKASEPPPQILEINPSHPIIIALSAASKSGSGKESTAELVTAQLFDNALIAADLIDDPRNMLSRLNEIMAKSISN